MFGCLDTDVIFRPRTALREARGEEFGALREELARLRVGGAVPEAALPS